MQNAEAVEFRNSYCRGHNVMPYLICNKISCFACSCFRCKAPDARHGWDVWLVNIFCMIYINIISPCSFCIIISRVLKCFHFKARFLIRIAGRLLRNGIGWSFFYGRRNFFWRKRRNNTVSSMIFCFIWLSASNEERQKNNRTID